MQEHYWQAQTLVEAIGMEKFRHTDHTDHRQSLMVWLLLKWNYWLSCVNRLSLRETALFLILAIDDSAQIGEWKHSKTDFFPVSIQLNDCLWLKSIKINPLIVNVFASNRRRGESTLNKNQSVIGVGNLFLIFSKMKLILAFESIEHSHHNAPRTFEQKCLCWLFLHSFWMWKAQILQCLVCVFTIEELNEMNNEYSIVIRLLFLDMDVMFCDEHVLVWYPVI